MPPLDELEKRRRSITKALKTIQEPALLSVIDTYLDSLKNLPTDQDTADVQLYMFFERLGHLLATHFEFIEGFLFGLINKNRHVMPTILREWDDLRRLFDEEDVFDDQWRPDTIVRYNVDHIGRKPISQSGSPE